MKNAIVKRAVLGILLSLGVFSCGSSNSNNPGVNPADPYYNGACPGCVAGTGATIYSSQSRDMYNTIILNMNFQAAAVNNTYMNNPASAGYGYNYSYTYSSGFNGYSNGYNPATTYSGQVVVTGQMVVSNANQCNLPVGTYSLVTRSPGYWNYATLQNLVVQASGPTQVTLTINGQKGANPFNTGGGGIGATGGIFGNVWVGNGNLAGGYTGYTGYTGGYGNNCSFIIQ